MTRQLPAALLKVIAPQADSQAEMLLLHRIRRWGLPEPMMQARLFPPRRWRGNLSGGTGGWSRGARD